MPRQHYLNKHNAPWSIVNDLYGLDREGKQQYERLVRDFCAGDRVLLGLDKLDQGTTEGEQLQTTPTSSHSSRSGKRPRAASDVGASSGPQLERIEPLPEPTTDVNEEVVRKKVNALMPKAMCDDNVDWYDHTAIQAVRARVEMEVRQGLVDAIKAFDETLVTLRARADSLYVDAINAIQQANLAKATYDETLEERNSIVKRERRYGHFQIGRRARFRVRKASTWHHVGAQWIRKVPMGFVCECAPVQARAWPLYRVLEEGRYSGVCGGYSTSLKRRASVPSAWREPVEATAWPCETPRAGGKMRSWCAVDMRGCPFEWINSSDDAEV